MGYAGKSLDQVHHDGIRRRRAAALKDQLYARSLRRWNRGLMIAGGLLAFPCSLLAPLSPLYAAYGAWAGHAISAREHHVLGGMLLYGGGHTLLAVIAQLTGLQQPGFGMALSWLAFLVVGGIMGLFIQTREWRVEHALRVLTAQGALERPCPGEAPPKDVPVPEIDPDLHRPGYIHRHYDGEDEAISFDQASATNEAQPEESSTTPEPPIIIDDEGFTPPAPGR